MNDLIICDYFKWTIKEVHDLSINEYSSTLKYLKKIDKENKKHLQKMKHKKR